MAKSVLYIPLRSYKTRFKTIDLPHFFFFISHYVHIKHILVRSDGSYKSNFISHYVHIKHRSSRTNQGRRNTLYPTTFI